MRSRRCSRIGSRKNLRSVLAFLLLVPAVAWAQIEHTTELVTTEQYLEVRMEVHGAQSDRLFANLDDGLSARIEYTIRILDPRERPWRALGSRMLREFRITYDLVRDPYRERFTVSTHDGGVYTFVDEAAVREFFFRLHGYRIPWSAVEPDAPARGVRELMVETRAVYEPIVFVPGLSILSVFLPDSRQQTSWSTVESEVPE